MKHFLSAIQALKKWLTPSAQSIADYNHRYDPAFFADRLSVAAIQDIFDTAQAGNTMDLFSLYRDIILSDSAIQTELSKRKLAVIGEPLTVLPWDKSQPADVAAATAFEQTIADCPDFEAAISHLLDSVLYPVTIVEKTFAPHTQKQPYRLERLLPVPHTLLDYATGALHIKDVSSADGRPLPSATPPDPSRYIIHRGHLLSTPDTYGGPMRAVVFWWLFAALSRSWWARWLERYGAPFPVGKYPRGQSAEKADFAAAFSKAAKVWGMAIPADCDVQLLQAAPGHADAYEKFRAVCRREITSLILGQTLSSEAAATGLGSGVADLHAEVRADLRRFDAHRLAVTITNQLARQFIDINSLLGRPPILIWGNDSAEKVRAMAELISSLVPAGLEPDDDAVAAISEKSGLAFRRRAVAPASPFPMTSRAAQGGGADPFFHRDPLSRQSPRT